jgi:hypothetical protein
MRIRNVAVLIAATIAFVAAGLTGIADAGVSNTFTVDKVVEGPVPDGAVFEVEIDCSAIDHNGAGPAGISFPVTVQFDATGAPIGTNSVLVDPGYQCTAVETVTNGAVVTYACEASSPDLNGDVEAEAEVDIVYASCTDDQTVLFEEINSSTGTITVTNTFEEEPEPETEPAGAAPAGVVAATPTFTG